MPSTSPTKPPQTITFGLTTNVPLLLLPVRLETRFRNNQLLIRVYPDAVHVDSFESRLTEVEIQWGKHFLEQTQLAKNEPTDEKRKDHERNAWTQLVQVFGPQRAAWIAKQVSKDTADPLVDPKTAHTPCTELLPDYWIASGLFSYEENGALKSDTLFKRGRDITYEGGSDRIFVMPRLDKGLTPDKFKDDPSVGWLVNFAKAEQIGMGLTIDLPGSKWKIDQLYVYGVKASLTPETGRERVEKLLDAHHYTQGLGFVSQGTPTNNTINASSGYHSGHSDAVDSFEIERMQTASNKPMTNYSVMAEALGIDPTCLVHVNDANAREQQHARDMNKALWESTWGYFLKEMLALKNSPPTDIDAMRDHFEKYVRARGPFPALRIGSQPYGLLPVLAIGEAKDDTVKSGPVPCLRALREIWRASLNRVPKLLGQKHREQEKDNSLTLLQVLAMTPTSIDYVGRNCTRIVPASSPTSTEGQASTGRTPWPPELQDALKAILGTTATPHQRTVFTSPSGLFLVRSPSDGDGAVGENDYTFLFNLLRDKHMAFGDLGELPPPTRNLLLRETLDLCSHRLDAWITSLAKKQLDELRTKTPKGLCIGGYGWVENLEPDDEENNKDPDGYIHAPSLAHATTAAILRSGYLVRRSGDTLSDSNALAINLSSDRIRLASHLVDGVRGGQSLGTLLGYRFERALHERSLDGFIPAFRKVAPGSAELITMATPNEKTQTKLQNLVLDGLKLLDTPIDWNSQDFRTASDSDRAQMQAELERLGEAIDAVADLVLAESVHHVAQGNPVRAGATLESITRGETPPPELEFIRTPRTGINHTHRISVVFDAPPTPSTKFPWGITTPRAQAEPMLNTWAAQLLGPQAQEAACTVTYTDSSGAHTLPVSIKALGLAPLDLVYLLDGELGGNDSEIEQRIVAHVQKQTPSATKFSLTFASSTGDLPPQLAEVLEVARTIRRLITGARALEARDVVSPEQAIVDAALPMDTTLIDRATAARDSFMNSTKALGDLLPEKPTAPLNDPQAVREALRGLAGYGLMGAIPSISNEHSDVAIKQLHAQARVVLNEAQTRQTRAQAIPASIQTTAQAVSVFKAVFGEDFRTLPSFTPGNGKDLTQTFAKSTAWQGGDPLTSITWFQRIARVRDGAARLDSTMQYAEALNEPLLNFQIGQLPDLKNEQWVALENPPPGNRLSLACLTTVKDFTKPIAGLLVEEWVESVPNKEEVTGLTFHYDAPQPRAPQALLLAVAPNGVDRWDSTTLENTLRETLELAKLRAVDLTALGELEQYLPAMYVDRTKIPDESRLPLEKGNR